ncbi:MAG TPA: UvrD-helicase domain-containing protein [Thermoanaerobacterales bacterium]|nr:UvrD-helicase domain-containing protein [Thermoanaerobacterales bacterium]
MDLQKIMEKYGVNDEQARALDIDKNIALHAGAGSGKTRVLSRRFLRLMLERDADVDSIVAITFTNKAALEMKERIRSLVNEMLLKERDPETVHKLNKIKEDIQAAHISTFHSFCDRILRENCHVIGLDPMYQVMEEVDRETVGAIIARDVVSKMLADMSFKEKFEKLFELFGTDYYYMGNLIRDIKYLSDRLRQKAIGMDEIVRKTEKNISRFYIQNALECFGDADSLEEIELFMVEMMEKVGERFEKYKIDKNLVDFNDLEIFTLKLLKDERIKNHYRRRFKYFLVDEFQDTNDVQREILYSLILENGEIPPGHLFIVGDVKQSIYGFRGADYEVFNSVTEKINENGKKLELSTCYRSHPDIVGVINKIFGNLFVSYEPLKISEGHQGRARVDVSLLKKEEKEDDLWKRGKVVLKSGSPEEVKNFLCELSTKQADDDVGNIRTIEAERLAEKIKNLTGTGFKYRDMAVLLRSRTNLSYYERVFNRENIPYCVIGGIGLFDKQEIVDLMNILKCIYDPGDKLALLGTLRAPYFGVPDDIILDIFDKLDDEGKVEQAMAALDKTEAEAIKSALNNLAKMRRLSEYHSVSDLVKMIIDSFHIKEVLLSLKDGIKMYRNVEKFMSIVWEFDSKDIYSPEDFLEYIQNLREISEKEAEADLDTEDSDAVKVLTIHASKGLEFTAVFIPEIGRDLAYNTVRNKPHFLLDDEYGVIARYDEKITGLKGAQNKLYDYVRERTLQKELEESKRILYVAATRAKRYLCFIGEDVELKDDDRLDRFVKMLKCALMGDGQISFVENDVKGKRTDKAESRCSEHVSNIFPDGEQFPAFLQRLDFAPDYKNKSSISISRYFTLIYCPRKFFYIYKAGIDGSHFEMEDEAPGYVDEFAAMPSGKLEGLVKGQMVHRILEKIIESDADVEEVVKQYAGFAAEDELREIKRLVQNFKIAEAEYEKRISGRRVKTEREIPFAVPLFAGGGKTVYGIIDRLDIYENNSSVEGYLIDYKTNRIKDQQDMERLMDHYRAQFMIYSLGFERLYPQIYGGIRLAGMFIFFLDAGKAIQVHFSGEEREEFLCRLSSTMDFVESHDDMEDYRCRDGCDYKCEYAFLCR